MAIERAADNLFGQEAPHNIVFLPHVCCMCILILTGDPFYSDSRDGTFLLEFLHIILFRIVDCICGDRWKYCIVAWQTMLSCQREWLIKEEAIIDIT